MKSVLRAGIVAVTALLVSSNAYAQAESPDLVLTTLEDLMNVEIRAASRKEQRAGDVAAAVHVISRDDIRRSGLRTLPELLRLAPGVQVARVDATKWAVSIRGFNNLYANKLLVLINGRSVYNRVFSGVFWGSQDVLVDDIERIEVVRGPGGAVWGANSVNGVINIVTRNAADARGVLVRLGSGTNGDAQGALRYGGSIAGVSYSLSSQWSAYGESPLDGAVAPEDSANTFANSLRADWTRGRNSLMVEGSVLANATRARWMKAIWPGVASVAPDTGVAADAAATARDASVLARWTHSAADGAELQVQSFVAARSLDNLTEREDERTADVDVQYYTKLGSRHDIVVGGGLRDDSYRAANSFALSLNGAHARRQVLNVFAQDEVSLPGRLRVTAASKVEHESTSGWSLQPTGRLLWEAVPDQQHLWIATSRALRTPSAIDHDLRLNYAAVPQAGAPMLLLGIVGNPNYAAERFTDAEVGYRVQLGSRATFDVTAFSGRYSGLPTDEPLAPVFEPSGYLFMASRFENGLDVHTKGIELTGRWTPARSWTFDASYSGLRLTPRLREGSRDATAGAFDGSAPRHQWQLRAGGQVNPRLELSGALYYAGRIASLDVPGHARLDVRAAFQVTKQLSLILTGRDLLEAAHREFRGDMVAATLVRRAATIQLAWRRR